MQSSKIITNKYIPTLHQFFTREISLFHCYLWSNAVCENSKKWIGVNIAEQLIYCPAGDEIVTVWYENNDIDAFFTATKNKVMEDSDFIHRLETYFLKYVDLCKPYFEGKTPATFNEMIAVNINMQHYFNGLAQIFDIIDLEGIPESTRSIALELRIKTQHFSKNIDETWSRYLKIHKPDLYKYRNVILCTDIQDDKLIRYDDLEERLLGYALYNGKLYTGNKLNELLNSEVFLHDEKIDLSVGVLKGFSVYKRGRIKGVAVVVTNMNQLKNVKKGHVLFVIATSPEYVNVMKQSLCVVADEGGITSHTAIVAREFKIPCVVGVKNATKIVKDGDMVEVDADNGIIKISGN